MFAASTRLGEPKRFIAILVEGATLLGSYLVVLLVVEDAAAHRNREVVPS